MRKKFLSTYEYDIDKDYESIKDYLRDKHNYSSRVFKSIIRNGKVTLNNEDVRFNSPIKKGDRLCVFFGLEAPDAKGSNLPIDVLYEDEDILIANKAPNMVVHPTKSHQEDTLANAIYYHWEGTGFKGKARFVNRIDMDTTGIVVIAKNKYVHHFIQEQSIKNQIDKEYLFLAQGVPKEKQGIIDAPIKREEEFSIYREVNENGKECKTQYQVIEEYENASLIKAKLLTGRTHQIRVHFAYINCPLFADELYNEQKTNIINRQALHAYKISFIHPRSKEKMEFIAPIPEDFKRAIERIKKASI